MDLKIQDFLKNGLNRNINAYEVSRRKQELIELSYKYYVAEEKFNNKYKNTKNIIFKLNAIRLVIAIIVLIIGVLTSFWIKNNTLCAINATVCWLNLLSFIPTKLMEHNLKTDKNLLNDFYYDVRTALLRYSLAFQDLKSKNAVNAYNDIYKILEKLCEKNPKNKKEIKTIVEEENINFDYLNETENVLNRIDKEDEDFS